HQRRARGHRHPLVRLPRRRSHQAFQPPSRPPPAGPRVQGMGRPEYQRMFDAARKLRFDVLLVWRYDRFARSMQELVNALEEFRTLGIDFISYRENADTTTARGKLIFGIMASLAEFERALIAERVKAGM